MILKDNKITFITFDQQYLRDFYNACNEVRFRTNNYGNKPYVGVLVAINDSKSYCLDFLNTDAGTGIDPAAQASGRTVLNTIMQDSNTVAIIAIISVISLSAVGGTSSYVNVKKINH